MTDLRHEVLTAQLERASLRDQAAPLSPEKALSSDDSALIGVRTAPGTPAAFSRSTSPSDGSSRSRSRSTRRSLEPHHRSSSKHSPLDPLRRFPPEIAQRIFLSVPVDTLANCSQVSRHWRRSATLNYCWFRHWQEEERLEVDIPTGFGSYVSPFSGLLLPVIGAGGATWTKRQSRTDWKKAYIRSLRATATSGRQDYLSSHGLRTAASRVDVVENKTRSQRIAESGGLSATALRRQQWADEARADAAAYADKEEMRDVYKSYGSKGGKVKGKSSKGGQKTWNEFAA